MTPHELINLPYAGQAEKQLRKQGDWKLTEQEKHERAMDKMISALDEIEDIAWSAKP